MSILVLDSEGGFYGGIKVVGDTVRVQNRLKALFRSRGIAVEGKAVFGQSKRASYLSALPSSCRTAAKVLYAEFDALKEIGQQAEQDLVDESHRHPASRILESCPGMGPIRVAQTLAVIVSPRRFRSRQQLGLRRRRKDIINIHNTQQEYRMINLYDQFVYGDDLCKSCRLLSTTME